MSMLSIRDDLTSEELRRLARRERDARVGRPMLAIARALEGMSRAAAARLAGMDRQTLRDWAEPAKKIRRAKHAKGRRRGSATTSTVSTALEIAGARVGRRQ